MIFLTSCFVLFYLSYVQASSDESKDFAEAKRDAHMKFAELLQQVINLNELRFNAMKELTRLEERKVSVNYLRARNDIKLDVGHMGSPIFIILGQQSSSGNLLSKLRQILNKNITQWTQQDSSSESSSDSSEDNPSDGLRQLKQCTRRNQIFCVKEASKTCRRSCVGVYRNTCLRYRCTRRFRREARRNCKKTCRKEFNRGKYEDSDSDTD